jgi:hypothetical protein
VTDAEKGGGGSRRTVVSVLEQYPSALCEWPTKHNSQMLSHHCYAPNIAYVEFILFPKVKDHLDDITLTQDTLEQAIMTFNTEEFAAAYHQ